MQERILTKFKKLDRRKRGIAIGAVALVIALIILLIMQLNRPERSVAAYCKVYGQEKARLAAMSNNSNPYPSGVFNASVTDAAQIATSLGKLDPVAPKEIEPEVSSLQKLYQDIHDNPSHAISNALNGGSLDDSLKAWTDSHCKAGK
jgi:cytochrome c556